MFGRGNHNSSRLLLFSSFSSNIILPSRPSISKELSPVVYRHLTFHGNFLVQDNEVHIRRFRRLLIVGHIDPVWTTVYTNESIHKNGSKSKHVPTKFSRRRSLMTRPYRDLPATRASGAVKGR